MINAKRKESTFWGKGMQSDNRPNSFNFAMEVIKRYEKASSRVFGSVVSLALMNNLRVTSMICALRIFLKELSNLYR